MSRFTISNDMMFFGKVPARGDFIKAPSGSKLVGNLDRWISAALEMMSTDTRWKLHYDALPPIKFAFLGSRSRVAVAGYLVASHDSAQRRFPLVAACTVETENPQEFMRYSPLALANVWAELEVLTKTLTTASDIQQLPAMNDRKSVGSSTAGYERSFQDFIRQHTISALIDSFLKDGHSVVFKRMFAALGILLQPFVTDSAARIEKGLVLPLPTDPHDRNMLATVWLSTIGRFFERGEFELAVFILPRDGRWYLIIGFTGAEPQTLLSVLSETASAERNITLDDPEWVDQYFNSEYSLRKLGRYLEEERLPFNIALETFEEAFLG